MVSRLKSLYNLSPDGSVRFFMMANIVNILNDKQDETIKILDVGGGSPYMASVLKESTPNHQLTTIDILPKPSDFYGRYIQGDATKMPFESKSFEMVISTDVMEHIPDTNKEAFIRECTRVAKKFVVIAAPFNTEGVDRAEHAVNDLNIKLFGENQVWLNEHFINKKPELDKTLKFIKNLGFNTEVVGTNNIYDWVLSTHVNLIEASLGLGKKKLDKINQSINEEIFNRSNTNPPFYRYFIIISKEKLTDKISQNLSQLVNLKMSHSNNVRYYHELINLIVDKIIKYEKELKKTKILSGKKIGLLIGQVDNLKQEVDVLKQEIDILKQDLFAKEVIIDKCRPYLTLLGVDPIDWAKRLFKFRDKKSKH